MNTEYIDFSERIGITNDFMFFSVFSDEKICGRFLKELLPDLGITSVKVRGQRTIKTGPETKAVRLDVQAKDANGNLYDIEMQLSSKFLPKRARYYLAITDTATLMAGTDYSDLPHSIVIILSPFDQFQLGQKLYLFEQACVNVDEEETAINFNDEVKQKVSTKKIFPLNDGTKVIYLNADGYKGEVSKDVQALLDLMKGEVDEGNNWITEINRKIDFFNKDKDWRADYMEYAMTLRHEFNAGKEQATLKAIKKLVAKSHCSKQEAVKTLVDPDEQQHYLDLLNAK